MAEETKKKTAPAKEQDKTMSLGEKLIAYETGNTKGMLEDSLTQMATEDSNTLTQFNFADNLGLSLNEAADRATGDKLKTPKSDPGTAAANAFNEMKNRYFQALQSDPVKPILQRAGFMGGLGDILALGGAAFGLPGLMVAGSRLSNSADATIKQATLPLAKFANTALEKAMSAEYSTTSAMAAKTGTEMVNEALKDWERAKVDQGIDPSDADIEALIQNPNVKASGLETYIRARVATLKGYRQDTGERFKREAAETTRLDAQMDVETAASEIKSSDTMTMDKIAEATEQGNFREAFRIAYKAIESKAPTINQDVSTHIEEIVNDMVGYTQKGEPVISTASSGDIGPGTEREFTGIDPGTIYIADILGIMDEDGLKKYGKITKKEAENIPALNSLEGESGTVGTLINKAKSKLQNMTIKKSYEYGDEIQLPTKYKTISLGGMGPSPALSMARRRIIDIESGLISVFDKPLPKDALPMQIEQAWKDAWANPGKFSTEFRQYMQSIAPILGS